MVGATLVDASSAYAATSQVTLAAVADTYTSSSAPTTDYGTSSSLGVYATPNNTAVVRFTIPTPPAGSTLTAATLRLRTTTLTSAGSANPANIRTATDTWAETGTVYSNRPTPSGPVLGTLPAGTTPNTTYDIPLTPSLTPGSTTLAIEGTGTDSLWLFSRQISTTTYRPTLTLTYTATDPATDPVTVMAVGDIACASGTAVTTTTCRHADVASLIAAAAPDRFISLGDMQYQTSTLAGIMAPGAYNDTFGAFKATTVAVIGNHEYLDQAQGYFDYFYGSGVDSGPLGTRPDGYYSQRLGAWTFIGLNSECDAGGVPGGCGVGSPQYLWLQNQLANAPTACTIVATHRPRWSTGASHGSYAPLAALWDLMASYHVDVMLSGHNHASEIFQPIGVSGSGTVPALAPDGIRAFTAGDGGANMQNLSPASDPLISALVARSRVAFGPLELTLADGSYSWQYRPIAGMTFTNVNTSGTFAGSDTCH